MTTCSSTTTVASTLLDWRGSLWVQASLAAKYARGTHLSARFNRSRIDHVKCSGAKWGSRPNSEVCFYSLGYHPPFRSESSSCSTCHLRFFKSLSQLGAPVNILYRKEEPTETSMTLADQRNLVYIRRVPGLGIPSPFLTCLTRILFTANTAPPQQRLNSDLYIWTA